MVAAQIHDADDRPEPRQHVGYRHLRNRNGALAEVRRSNHKAEQTRNAGVHERCLQPQNAYPAFWAPFEIVAEVFLLLSSPLTTAIDVVDGARSRQRIALG